MLRVHLLGRNEKKIGGGPTKFVNKRTPLIRSNTVNIIRVVVYYVCLCHLFTDASSVDVCATLV